MCTGANILLVESSSDVIHIPSVKSVPRSVTQAQSSHNGVKYFMKLHSNFEATKNDHEKEKASEVISQPPLGIVLQRIDSKFKCCPYIRTEFCEKTSMIQKNCLQKWGRKYTSHGL